MFLLFFLALCYSCTTFFLIRHIYKLYTPKRKDSYHCDRKLFFTLCRKFSSEKVFLLFTTRYYFIFSDNYIYLTLYFSLVAICQWPLSSLRIPPDPTPLYPYESSLSQKFHPKSLKNQTPHKWLSRNWTAKVIPFYYTTKLFANFFGEKYFTHNQRYDIHTIGHVFFLSYGIEFPIILLYYIAVTLLLSGKQ